MFSCFNPDKRPGRRCEWKGGNLQEFVSQYNRECGTTYVLVECLDAPKSVTQQAGLKQPEVLVEGSRGERPMVIERKQVVAESYATHHSNLHVLYEAVPESLAPHLGDALYVLEVTDAGLRGKWKGDVKAAVEEISDHVLANLQSVRGGTAIGGQRPFPWRFSRVPAHARDDDAPEVGIGVQIHGSDTPADDPKTLLRQVAEAYAETKKLLERVLAEAEPKFVAYQDHLKVVVLEFYGDRNLLDEDDARRVVGEVELPALIDEVWVARPEWVSEWDYEIGYDRAR